MIYPIVFLIGAAFGWFRAARRGGDRLDKLHYAAVHGIVLTLAVALVVIVGAALRAG